MRGFTKKDTCEVSDTTCSKSREWFIRLGLVFGSLLLGLVVAEVTLRIAQFKYSPLHIENYSTTNDYRKYHAFNDSHFEYDPELIWRPVINLNYPNKYGYRGASLTKEIKENELRLFAIGDSNTMGWKGDVVNHSSNWPMIMENVFDWRGKNLVVTNAGAYGYSSYQGNKLIDRLLPFKPDVLLVSFGCNDAHLTFCSDEYFVENSIATNPIKNGSLLRSSRTLQLFASVWDTYYVTKRISSGAVKVHRVSPKDYRVNLIKIIKKCQAQKVFCVLLTRPYLGPGNDPEYWKYYAPTYCQITKDVAREYQTDLIDVYEYFKDKPKLFADESHFTEEGHKVAAQFICDALTTILEEADNPKFVTSRYSP